MSLVPDSVISVTVGCDEPHKDEREQAASDLNFLFRIDEVFESESFEDN